MTAAASAGSSRSLVEVREVTVEYQGGRGRPPLRAVDGVSLAVGSHETVGLVGESGSGKTTIGRAILGLTPVTEGTVLYDGVDITHASYRERRKLSSHLQVVFQDPYSSLNPTRTIGQTLAETLWAKKLSRSEENARVSAMLERVGLPPEAAKRYPGAFSGGQRQRVAIARALMVRPRFVVCDEPVSALDLSVQAQVLNLLRELQEDFGLSYLFIAHDLAVVRNLSHLVIVLYRGRIMEQGATSVVNRSPAHPYTCALLEAAPVPDPELQRQRRLARAARGVDLSSQVTANACPFVGRCPHATDICSSERPMLERTPEGSLVACHHWRRLRDQAATLAGARR
jgi:oligopeptide/dipeptide ABC transporter ATP-binding protein